MSGLYIIYKCLTLFYYFISDIVIYLIYIDLMRKRCQLINVDVDVDVDSSLLRLSVDRCKITDFFTVYRLLS